MVSSPPSSFPHTTESHASFDIVSFLQYKSYLRKLLRKSIAKSKKNNFFPQLLFLEITNCVNENI